jgi:hypothetical protein
VATISRVVLPLCIIGVLSPLAGPARTPPSTVNPFVVGEELNYEASWSSFIVAGELNIRVVERGQFDGVDAYRIIAQAQTVGVVDAVIYKVRDTYESFVNAGSLAPFRALRRARHGKKREQNSFTIDTKRRVAVLGDGRTIEFTDAPYDMASLLYAIRAMDLTPGRSREFTLLEEDKLHKLRVEPEAREKVRTRAGSYDAMRIGIKIVEARGLNDRYKLRLYVTPDARRLPVLLTASPLWGEIRVELTQPPRTYTQRFQPAF